MSLSGAFTLMEDMELAHDWLNEIILNIPSQDEFIKSLELILFNFEEYEKVNYSDDLDNEDDSGLYDVKFMSEDARRELLFTRKLYPKKLYDQNGKIYFPDDVLKKYKSFLIETARELFGNDEKKLEDEKGFYTKSQLIYSLKGTLLIDDEDEQDDLCVQDEKIAVAELLAALFYRPTKSFEYYLELNSFDENIKRNFELMRSKYNVGGLKNIINKVLSDITPKIKNLQYMKLLGVHSKKDKRSWEISVIELSNNLKSIL